MAGLPRASGNVGSSLRRLNTVVAVLDAVVARCRPQLDQSLLIVVSSLLSLAGQV